MKFIAIWKKEMREQVRNRKLLFTTLFVIGVAFLAMYTDAGPTDKSSSVLEAIFDLFRMFCPILGILIGADAIVGEKEKGTLELILAKPLSRTTLVLGKFAAYVLSLVPLLAFELILVYYWAQASGISTHRWKLPMPPLNHWLHMVVILCLLTTLYVIIATFASLYARTTISSAMISMLFILPASPMGTEILKWVGWTDVGSLSIPARMVISVFEKYQEYALISSTDFWICTLSLLSLTAVLLLVAGWRFEKQDISFGT